MLSVPTIPRHKFGALPALVAGVCRLIASPKGQIAAVFPHAPTTHAPTWFTPPPPPFHLVVPVGPSRPRSAQIYCAAAAAASRLAAPCCPQRGGRHDEGAAALLGARTQPPIGAALSGGPLMHSSLPLPAPSCSVLTFASPLRCCYQAVWGRRRLRWAATGVGVVPAGGPPRDHVTHRGRPRRLLLFLTVPPPPGGRLRLRAHRLAATATLRGGFALPVASLVVPFPYPLSPLVAVDGARG